MIRVFLDFGKNLGDKIIDALHGGWSWLTETHGEFGAKKASKDTNVGQWKPGALSKKDARDTTSAADKVEPSVHAPPIR